MFNELTSKVRFHIVVWSLSNAIKASSFIENIPQISTKPIAFQRNLLEKLSRNRPFFTNRFQRNWPRKFLRNRPFFPRICLRKSREIWLFFPRPTRSPGALMFRVVWGYSKFRRKNVTKSYKAEIKILAKPGLAQLMDNYWL